ncbi:MAG: hypothetical protein J7D61_07690 [Marichromatium sp.]|nr:hypothetical protein [Marichromatium sp.]
MTEAKIIEIKIQLDRLYLDKKNPRHEPYETQAEIIEHLCAKEEIAELARDISKRGLSPLDQLGVLTEDQNRGKNATYTVAEGNRRICALKLLTDPDLAPKKHRVFFEKLAEKWTPINELKCVVFNNRDDLKIWLERRHHGFAGGVGQKQWNAEQKSRHSGKKDRNLLALSFLDYVEREGLLNAKNREKRLTTVQRYLGNPVMRSTLGLKTEPEGVKCSLNKNDLHIISHQFLTDMIEKREKVNSRKNKDEIIEYARELENLQGLTRERTTPYLLNPKNAQRETNKKPQEPNIENQKQSDSTQESKNPRKKEQAQPNRPSTKPPKNGPEFKNLPFNPSIEKELKKIESQKLQSLYYSICNIPLENHTPLLAVGVWSFIETITAKIGREEKTDFLSFLSQNRLENYGFSSKENKKAIKQAVERIQDFGNTTKHHKNAACFNKDQLYNDLETLNELILKIIADAISQKT